MEIVRCHFPQFAAPLRVGKSSSSSSSWTFHGGKDFSAVVNKNLRLNGEIGDRVQGRNGASEQSEQVELLIRAIRSRGNDRSEEPEQLKLCVRCGMTYRHDDNSPISCKYHGHMTGYILKSFKALIRADALDRQAGDRGLYALAPPHQGIDGDWTDASGVIVYKWNNENERPSTGSKNWKRRWTCCGVYAEDAVPCQSGSHVSYDDGATRY